MKKKTLNPFLKAGMALGTLMMLVTAFSSCQKKNLAPTVASYQIPPAGTPVPAAIPTTLSEGLIAYWTCAGTPYDLSGNNNNGAIHGVSQTADRQGEPGGAYHFNGTGNYIMVPDSPALRLDSTDFTLNAWVRLNAYNSSYASSILDKRSAIANHGWAWNVTGHTAPTAGLLSYDPGAGSYNAYGVHTISTGTWHMVTSIYKLSTHTMRLYIDGVLDDSTQHIASPVALDTAKLYIGRNNPVIADSVYYFEGGMNDIRMYNRAISAVELSELYNAPTAPTSGIIAFWPLSNTAKDLSNNGHNGTAYNTTLYTDRLGNPHGAYYFNGTSSYISVPDSLSLRLDSTDFTLNAWVKITAYNSSYESSIVNKHTTGSNSGWSWTITGSASATAGLLSYNSGGSATALGTGAIATGGWHMVTSVYTLSNHTLKIYIDGAANSTTTGISSPSALASSVLYIGKDNPAIVNNGYYFQGGLNDIRIYNRAVTTTEIGQLYNALD